MKKTRFIIVTEIKSREIINLLKDLYTSLDIKYYNDLLLITYNESFDQPIEEIIETINIDFGTSIHVHEGFILNKNFNNNFLNEYITFVKENNLLKQQYTNLTDIFYLIRKSNARDILNDYYIYILKPLIEKEDNRLIIETYFNNNMNVLKTSKVLYMNRNSLTKRLETMSKVIGYNIQTFKVASLVLFLMKI